MKKLERLTLKELGESVDVLDRKETIGLKGGNADNGNAEYFMKYGENLPAGVGYDFIGDKCYEISGGSAGTGSSGAGGGNSNSSSVNSSPNWAYNSTNDIVMFGVTVEGPGGYGGLFGEGNSNGISTPEDWAKIGKVALGAAYLAGCAAYGFLLGGTDFGYTVVDPPTKGSTIMEQ
jgi:hypothetical protein